MKEMDNKIHVKKNEILSSVQVIRIRRIVRDKSGFYDGLNLVLRLQKYIFIMIDLA